MCALVKVDFEVKGKKKKIFNLSLEMCHYQK